MADRVLYRETARDGETRKVQPGKAKARKAKSQDSRARKAKAGSMARKARPG
jgi:hypothetical protein